MTLQDRPTTPDEIGFAQLIEKRREENRRADSLLAVLAWVGCSVWWIATTPRAHFLSWQAPVLVVVGMFAASILIGGGAYLLKTGLQAGLMRLPAPLRNPLAALAGLASIVVELVVVYHAAGYALGVLLR
jgi:hypothetical protein